jgi:hypothetical protein
VGWGESSLEGHTEAVEGALIALCKTFLGWDGDKIQDIWQHAYRSRFYRGGPVLMVILLSKYILSHYHTVSFIVRTLRPRYRAVGYQRQETRCTYLAVTGWKGSGSCESVWLDRRRLSPGSCGRSCVAQNTRFHCSKDEWHRYLSLIMPLFMSLT